MSHMKFDAYVSLSWNSSSAKQSLGTFRTSWLVRLVLLEYLFRDPFSKEYSAILIKDDFWHQPKASQVPLHSKNSKHQGKYCSFFANEIPSGIIPMIKINIECVLWEWTVQIYYDNKSSLSSKLHWLDDYSNHIKSTISKLLFQTVI